MTINTPLDGGNGSGAGGWVVVSESPEPTMSLSTMVMDVVRGDAMTAPPVAEVSVTPYTSSPSVKASSTSRTRIRIRFVAEGNTRLPAARK